MPARRERERGEEEVERESEKSLMFAWLKREGEKLSVEGV
jgi:hypothetical protein